MQVQQTVEKIAERVLPRATFVVTPTTPATSRAMDVTYVPPVVTPEAGQSPVAKVLSKLTGPSGVTWTKLLETRHLVVPSEQHPSLPADPSPKLPVPAPAPVQCTCGSDGSGAAGSHKAAFAASGDVHGTSVERALAPSTDEVTVKPGKQPPPPAVRKSTVALFSCAPSGRLRVHSPGDDATPRVPAPPP
ncbi:hypothetical protein BBK82_14795 [Lentzea guizhouensis]|uniref:Uncharacterized protein n=1 Tax=Lentzea guizhouensis TaxID=1586287 RepID=A0A1B2HHF6_9PSEU|nr:hypothetical protein [Lentzea guizhouensis]ANZ37145.1 hypothetical protein BBK82_14795 [Lentzea guizhouensis]